MKLRRVGPTVLALLVGAGGVTSPAEAALAPFVRSVQPVDIAIPNGQTTGSAALSAGTVVTSCVPFATLRGAGTEIRGSRTAIDLSFATAPVRVVAARVDASGDLVLRVYVVEFEPASVRVQQGTISPKNHDYGISVAEDKNGVIYVGAARGRPNLWLREEGAMSAILRSSDKGKSWDSVIDNLNGGVMHLCPAPDGNGMIAGTSDGTLLVVDDSGAHEVVKGLPFVTSVELAA